MKKTVTFLDEEAQNAIEGRTDGGDSREREPGKWIVGMVLIGMDHVWKWAGARDGLQVVSEVRDWDGFQGWYWRSSVGSWGVPG